MSNVEFSDGTSTVGAWSSAMNSRAGMLYGRPPGARRQRRRSSVYVPEEDPHEMSNAEEKPRLGMFSGVYVPTTLNVLSILMFLRFGFLIGQAGILGVLLMLLLSYLINLLTTLSISAIATNGVVRGGGAYYMISRSLGPEFGTSIGVIFYVGQILNTGLNLIGFFEPLVSNFGVQNGVILNVIPDGLIWIFVYTTALLLICVGVCIVGSKFFTRSSTVLLVILLTSIISIPISGFLVQPYIDPNYDNAMYTGFSWLTFKENLLPKFTKGAAGSKLVGQKENFQDIFGILFPATSGIFAGASMSGDLKSPSKSIPQGTLWGLVTTFVLYFIVILSIGSSVSRELLRRDIQVIQNVNISSYIIVMGELATSIFSALMGVIGASNLLLAIAKDDIFPYTLKMFTRTEGTKTVDNHIAAIWFTYALTQLTLFLDINQIAIFITMAFLMTFVVTNLACFLLKIASAPNFRPSFKYFTSSSAAFGAILSVLAMFIADGLSASGMIVVLLALFLLIHYTSPPKPWGDVSQSLIYHQVRKYLLRLRQDHVKFWRPQILLLVDDPRTCWKLIHFCNHLKKGGLYILGHVMITKDFHDSFPEMKRQQVAWLKLRTISKVKGFVQIAAGPDVVWGARNVYIGSGLGGMKPNITVLGFFEKRNHMEQEYSEHLAIDIETLPTDSCRREPTISVTEWVNIIEDLVTMQANIAIAKGFPKLEFPNSTSSDSTKYIDLYPIQMSAQIVNEDGQLSGLTTNFDTYTLILQMGAILRTVPDWKRAHQLRVIVFVEYQEDVESEESRIEALLDKLRINAKIIVLCLNSGDFGAYNTLINNAPDVSGRVSKYFKNNDWWIEVQEARKLQKGDIPQSVKISSVKSTDNNKVIRSPSMSRHRRTYTTSELHRMGVSLSIQTGNPMHDFEEGIDFESESDSDEEITFERSFRRKQQADRIDDLNVSTATSSIDSLPKSDHAVSGVDSLKARKLKPNFSGTAMPQTKVMDDNSESGNRTIMFEERAHPCKSSSLRTEIENITEQTPLLSNVHEGHSESDEYLSFNDLPAKAQHMILNDVMYQQSGNSTVIFTTLPAPAYGTYKSKAESLEYVESLELWCQDLPPVILLHSQSMTVTTAL